MLWITKTQSVLDVIKLEEDDKHFRYEMEKRRMG